MLDEIECALTWRPSRDLSLPERFTRSAPGCWR
jgi:hypothetical protein